MFSLPKELRKDVTGKQDERALGGRNRKLDWQQG
jgi:4-hydroxy-3-methylbut-2-enyl diphosphate reductase